MNAKGVLTILTQHIKSEHVYYSDEFEQSQSLIVYNDALKSAAEGTDNAEVKAVIVEAYSESITLETAIKRAFA